MKCPRALSVIALASFSTLSLPSVIAQTGSTETQNNLHHRHAGDDKPLYAKLQLSEMNSVDPESNSARVLRQIWSAHFKSPLPMRLDYLIWRPGWLCVTVHSCQYKYCWGQPPWLILIKVWLVTLTSFFQFQYSLMISIWPLEISIDQTRFILALNGVMNVTWMIRT